MSSITRFAAALMVLSTPAAPALAQDGRDPATPASAAEPTDWADTARRDVLAAYDAFVRNHPGIYDLANPGFPAQLAQARARGLEAAAKAQDLRGYSRALAEFSAVLQDGHAGAGVPSGSQSDGEPVWPGFIAVWRGEGLFVRTQDKADPLYGARFVSCEGEPIEAFLRDRLTMRYFRPNEAGQWWVRPMQLFYASAGLQDEQPRSCTFKLPDGAQTEVAFDWRPLSKDEEKWRSIGFWGDREPTALSEKRDGIYFIGLQDFDPDEAGVAAFDALYADVRARRDELKDARALVLDLRRNGGGGSRWSERLADILWGEDAVEARTVSSADVLWRTSPGNTAYIASVEADFRANGEDEVADFIARLAEGMRAAHERGEVFFAESALEEETAAETARETSPETDFATTVYVIVAGNCASACLDALDYFTPFENVTLIGAPSSADSTYMDVRTEDLPAGPGIVTIPNKVYVGRKRGWGEVYSADIEMTDLDWSTSAFLDAIENDLAAR
ncbi:S41 family peptidase [Alteriqipengyuania sp. 357]